MQDCPAPKPEGRTNGLLASYALALRDALERCNLDKQALRDWASSIK